MDLLGAVAIGGLGYLLYKKFGLQQSITAQVQPPYQAELESGEPVIDIAQPPDVIPGVKPPGLLPGEYPYSAEDLARFNEVLQSLPPDQAQALIMQYQQTGRIPTFGADIATLALLGGAAFLAYKGLTSSASPGTVTPSGEGISPAPTTEEAYPDTTVPVESDADSSGVPSVVEPEPAEEQKSPLSLYDVLPGLHIDLSSGGPGNSVFAGPISMGPRGSGNTMWAPPPDLPLEVDQSLYSQWQVETNTKTYDPAQLKQLYQNGAISLDVLLHYFKWRTIWSYIGYAVAVSFGAVPDNEGMRYNLAVQSQNLMDALGISGV